MDRIIQQMQSWQQINWWNESKGKELPKAIQVLYSKTSMNTKMMAELTAQLKEAKPH